MRNFTLLLSFLLLGTIHSFAQIKKDNTLQQQVRLANRSFTQSNNTNYIDIIDDGKQPNGYITDRCGFATQMNKAIAGGFDNDAFEAAINAKIAAMKASNFTNGVAATTNYIIPVVFHVINDGGAEGSTADNVAQSQIYEQIDQLNKDFGNMSNSPFAVAATTGLTFCPVLKDPQGNTLAKPGIDRINRITKGWTDPTTFGSSNAQINAMINYIDDTIKPQSIWDPEQYVNIWMYNFTNSGLLGYATFPTAGLPDLPGGETPTTAGVVFLSGSIGSVASPGPIGQYGLGRTTTHELGHFFGLRHIWGDVNTCNGTDFCADTPPCNGQYFSGTSTGGCMQPAQCSSLPRMTENYMDYSDDACMNTYTQNQTDRVQAVMAAAPRRPRNPSSTLCTPPVADAISFTTSTSGGAETGSGTTCPNFKDYIINIKPAIAASGNATINFTIGGTATLNSDYNIIGNTSVNYTNGDDVAKGFIIRVIDDAMTEPTENIVINFNITGNGLVRATINQTHTINIIDNDKTIFINNLNPNATLLTEDFGTTANGGLLPDGWTKGQFLATPGRNLFTVNSTVGSIVTGFTDAGRVLHITNNNTTNQTNEVAQNTYNNTSESDAVAVIKPVSTVGFGKIKLAFDYAVNGEQDANGTYDYGALVVSTTSANAGFNVVRDGNGNEITFVKNTAKTRVNVNLPDSISNKQNVWIGFEWLNDDNIGANPGITIDNIEISADANGVESAANQTVTQTQNNAQSAQYISSTNNIIAAIENLNQNIGCITATVAADGTSLIPITTNTGNYSRSQKVINITPATANATANYTATFYYTTAELAAFGASINNLKLMKVKDGVALNSTFTSTNAALFSVTVDDQRTAKGYAAFTANVTGGFSQFFLVTPTTTLPITLTAFTAKPIKNTVQLNWSTSAENNNKGFAIERSTNGINFEKIAFVNTLGNANTTNNYSYVDKNVATNVTYYYRLKQTDVDDKFTLSAVRKVTIDALAFTLTIAPNPASNYINIVANGSTGVASLSIINTQGQVVKNIPQINLSNTNTIDISNIAAGVYIIRSTLNGNTINQKLIIN